MKHFISCRTPVTFGALLIVALLLSSQVLAQSVISVGTGSGDPGDSVLIPIEFSNDGDVAAFNFDIVYDPFAFPSVDFESDCDGNLLSIGTVVCTNPSFGVIRVIVYTFPGLGEVASGQIGTIEFFSDPTASGSYPLLVVLFPEFLSISDNSGGPAPAILIDGEIILGSGLGVLDVQPPEINFGSVLQGSGPLTGLVTITNNLSSDDFLDIDDYFISGALAFSIGSETTCPLPPFSLAVGDSCEVEVIFDPADIGLQLAQLIVEAPTADILNDRTDLIADVFDDDAELAAIPGALNFGNLIAGSQSACQTLSVENMGVFGTLNITNITFGGSPFFLQNNSCIDAVLEPEDACSIDVCFIPGANQVGAFNDTLNIFSSANSIAVPLAGTGDQPPSSPFLQVSPALLDFGTVAVDGAPVCLDLVASNLGVEGNLTGISVTVPGGEPFSVGADGCTGTSLAPSGSCTISVCFSSASAGVFSGQVLLDSAVNSGDAILQGQAEEARPLGELTIAPANLDFGTRLVGTPPLLATFGVSNVGPENALDVILDSFELQGDSAFTRLGGSCQSGQVLSVNASPCTVIVAFAPGSAAEFTALLDVQGGMGESARANMIGRGQIIEAGPLDDLIVFRGERFLDSVGQAMDFVRGFIAPGRTELMLGAPGLADNEGAVWVISDILLGQGAFLDVPPLLSDIAAADGRAGVRITPESGQLNNCYFGNQGFGYGVVGLAGRRHSGSGPLTAISAPGWGGPQRGRGVVYLLQGPPPADQGSVSVSAWLDQAEPEERDGVRLIRGLMEGPCIGSGLRALGNIDGSGESALAIQELPGSLEGTAAGQLTYVVHQPGRLIGSADVNLAQSQPGISRIFVPFNEGMYFPVMSTVAALGDFNGNGFDDIAVTAPNARFYSVETDSWHAGAAFVIFGREGGLPTDISVNTQISAATLGEQALVIFGPRIVESELGGTIGADFLRFGASVDGAGDFNGNGFADLLIGLGATENLPGSAVVIFGGDIQGPLFVDELPAQQRLFLSSIDSGDRYFGESVRGIGDFSGNGFDDILIGAPWSSVIGTDGVSANEAGRVYLVQGGSYLAEQDANEPGDSADEVDNRVRVLSLGERLPAAALTGSRFGQVMVAARDDVTGNGVSDLAISAWRGLAADNQTGGGWAVVVPGIAEPSSLALTVTDSPPVALIPGRPLVLRVDNTGPAQVNNLVLSLVVDDAELPIEAALTMLQGCAIDSGEVGCPPDTQPIWQCELGSGSAVCRLPALALEDSISLLLVIADGAPGSLSILLDAANASSIELTTSVD